MDREKLQVLLESLQEGEITVGEAMESFRRLPFEDLGFAKLDTHRSIRRGFPEVVYCPGKAADQVATILQGLARDSERVLATRADPEVYDTVRSQLTSHEVAYFPEARLILVGSPASPERGHVVVATGGTSDRPVAEEAAVTCEVLGNRTARIYDVGVAGVHRLLDQGKPLGEANVAIVVAGMEGALPSAVAGLIEAPVIAVPTSVGYGANFDGLAALLAMMNTCVPGVAVVNVDNGFGAGFFANLINAD
ncbi:MAG: nickel pincer cofactor biosynthesis protein LarB [Thermoplasmata archaeon]